MGRNSSSARNGSSTSALIRSDTSPLTARPMRPCRSASRECSEWQPLRELQPRRGNPRGGIRGLSIHGSSPGRSRSTRGRPCLLRMSRDVSLPSQWIRPIRTTGTQARPLAACGRRTPRAARGLRRWTAWRRSRSERWRSRRPIRRSSMPALASPYCPRPIQVAGFCDRLTAGTHGR